MNDEQAFLQFRRYFASLSKRAEEHRLVLEAVPFGPRGPRYLLRRGSTVIESGPLEKIEGTLDCWDEDAEGEAQACQARQAWKRQSYEDDGDPPPSAA